MILKRQQLEQVLFLPYTTIYTIENIDGTFSMVLVLCPQPWW